METVKISEELQELLDKAEEMDWTYKVDEEKWSGKTRTYAELFKPSPAGEDFSILVEFEEDNQAETFLQDLRNYVSDFDSEEHAKKYIPVMGKGGCPDSIRELLDDADSIRKMCEELLDALVETAETVETDFEVSKELQEMLDKAGAMGWFHEVYEKSGQHNKAYIKMGKRSPAGEDFSLDIPFDITAENQAETFLENLWDHAVNFDIDAYVEMNIPRRGQKGCPSSIKGLLEDTEAILEMIKELDSVLYDVLHPELSDEQSARCNEIYNTAYELCKVMTEDENLEWDMHYLGEIAEAAADMMVKKGYRVRFPAVVTEKDGRQHIEEYYKPDEEA